ncbi:hypothetical protein [Arthrobacter sp. NPDC090010]|uniref:hypothetical protein n=1 Tax=Arthrobacter sp. NPDC090010 TaxID=3363942 RepID=UPI0038252058
MRQQHIDQAISHGLAGRSVAVFGETHGAAQAEAAQIIAATPTEHATRISRQNGNHYIEFSSGGKVRFYSTNPNTRGLRGLLIDTAFVPSSTERSFLDSLDRNRRASSNIEFVHY